MADWRGTLRDRLAGLRLDPAREVEIIEELEVHLEQRYQELRAAGLADDASLATALAELLEPDALARYLRPLKLARQPEPVTPGAPSRGFLTDLWQDLRLAGRVLRKQAGLTTTAVLTLALGIGATGAIFSLVDTVLLRDLPFPAAERVMMLRETTAVSPAGGVSPLNLRDWADRSESIEAVGGFMQGVGAMVMGSDEGPETISRQWVTDGVFRALGVTPIVGRTFLPEDDTNGLRAVVMSESLWRTRFSADPSIAGRQLVLDGESFTVVGVVPDSAQVIGRASLWGLFPTRSLQPGWRNARPFLAVARLQPETSQEGAQTELNGIAADLATEFPDSNTGRGVSVVPFRDVVLGLDLTRSSMLFLGIAGLVLLLCCANIANLLLTRTAARRQELSIRSALGADRARLLRQFWTENLVLSLLGGVAGAAVAAILLRLAPAVIPPTMLPPGFALGFDARIAAFCGLAAIIVGVVFSLLSARQVTRLAEQSPHAPDTRVTGRSDKTRELLVIGQVAVAVALLYGAGLLSRTLIALDDADRGYRAPSVLTMLVDPHSRIYPDAAALLRFYEAVEQEIESSSAVADVAWTSTLPYGGSETGPRFYEVQGQPAPSPAERPQAQFHSVSGDYFRTIGQPLLTGRTFGPTDTADSPSVCLASEAMGASVGQRIFRWLGDTLDALPAECEVVGIVADTRVSPDELAPVPQLYVPLSQFTLGDIYLIVRPQTGDASQLTASVRTAIGRVDREQLVVVRDIRTLDAISRDATASYRFRAALVITFGALALVLAMIGLYGILAYAVQTRWREYGVRTALGASTKAIGMLIAKNAARLVAPGVILGTALALVIGNLTATMLFQVTPFDVATLAAVLAILAFTAAAAIAGPTVKATAIDPADALRDE